MQVISKDIDVYIMIYGSTEGLRSRSLKSVSVRTLLTKQSKVN